MTFEAWELATDAQRRVWLDGLLERLPVDLELDPDTAGLPQFSHRTGVGFILIFEDVVRLGLDADRLAAVDEAINRSPMTLYSPEVHVPIRDVTVPMHLCARRPIEIDGYDWVMRTSVPRVLEVLSERGWRLPSECEWELQWNVGRSRPEFRFGEPGDLCLDSWHISYQGAPRDASAWGTGAELVKYGQPDPTGVHWEVTSRRPIRSVGMVQVRPVIDVPSIG